MPLRSLVSEKYRELVKHYSETDLINRIYASSSDYQKDDNQITSGNYSIVIMVYEKFLALRADSQSSILKNCKLIIVDELQMLGNNSRGDKLEAVLTDVLITQNHKIRIVGLTTNACNMEKVSQWLDDAYIICDDQRPITLDEYVISPSGKYKALLNKKLSNGNFYNCAEYRKYLNQNGDDSKRELLKNIIQLKYDMDLKKETVKSKILVFFANKDAVTNLCGTIKNFIKHKGYIDTSEELIKEKRAKFEKLCLDENEAILFNRYFQYGVAYHHSGLSYELREFIENELRDERGILNIVFATETLTVGINMPFDMVIIYSLQIPDGANSSHNMYSYEYKNYIGRAGRRGKGESYLFADNDHQIYTLFEQYINASPMEITSCISVSNPLALTPFLLSWLSGADRNGGISGQITVDTASQYIMRTFLMYDKDKAYANCVCKKMLDFLCSGNIIETNGTTYGMLRAGRDLAGYIYFPSTYSRIIRLVSEIEKYIGEQINSNTELDNVFDSLVLAILYNVCQYDDIISKGFFSRERNLYVNTDLKTFMLDIVRNKNSKMKIVALSFVSTIEYENFIEERFLSFAKAIMLIIWSNGLLLSKNEYFPFSGIKTGEMQALAELVSYMLEGIASHCASRENRIVSECLSRKLFDFAGCVKYGQRYEMKHIRKELKISRGRIIQVVKTMGSSDTKDFIEYITCSDKVETDLQELARQKFISTKELISLPSVTDELFDKYINSYDERSKNIRKYLFISGIDRCKDNHDLFLEILNYTSVFNVPINFTNAEQNDINNEKNIKREFFYLTLNGEEYRIMLYYDHWSEGGEVEDIEFEDFLTIVRDNHIHCIIGPQLPPSCVDCIQELGILYMENRAFLLACLYTYRLKEPNKLQWILEHNKGYISIKTINSIYKSEEGKNAIHQRDFFISYCHKDCDNILPEVLEQLEKAGFTYWCDRTERNSEHDMDDYIINGLNMCRCALFIGTENYFTDLNANPTPYRRRELTTCRSQNKLGRILVFDKGVHDLIDNVPIVDVGNIPRIPVDRNNWPDTFKHPNLPNII